MNQHETAIFIEALVCFALAFGGAFIIGVLI